MVHWLTLVVCHSPVASRDAQLVLAEILPKPVRGKAKQSCPPRKTFSAFVCSSFNVKVPPSSDTELWLLQQPCQSLLQQQLGSQSLHVFLLLFLQLSRPALQQSLPAFITAKKTLIGDKTLTRKHFGLGSEFKSLHDPAAS